MNQLPPPQVLAQIYLRGEAEMPASFVLRVGFYSVFKDFYNSDEVPY